MVRRVGYCLNPKPETRNPKPETRYPKRATCQMPYMVSRGVYFDSTPCLDISSDGETAVNPYVRAALWTTAVYTAGGVCNLLATVLLLVRPPAPTSPPPPRQPLPLRRVES